MDILQSHKQQKKMFSRLYFKVNIDEFEYDEELFKSRSQNIIPSKKETKSVQFNFKK